MRLPVVRPDDLHELLGYDVPTCSLRIVYCLPGLPEPHEPLGRSHRQVKGIGGSAEAFQDALALLYLSSCEPAGLIRPPEVSLYGLGLVERPCAATAELEQALIVYPYHASSLARANRLSGHCHSKTGRVTVTFGALGSGTSTVSVPTSTLVQTRSRWASREM